MPCATLPPKGMVTPPPAGNGSMGTYLLLGLGALAFMILYGGKK